MTEQNEPDSPPTAQPPSDGPSPILGIDPPAPQSAPVPETPAEAPSEPQGHSLTDEQFTDLQSKAALWDQIENDAQLSQLLNDHLQARARGPMNPPEQKQTQETPTDDPVAAHPIVKDLVQQLRQTQENNAKMAMLIQLQEFRRMHPDVDSYETEMVDLISKHNMNLDTAYRYAKAAKGKQAVSAPASPGPSAEGRGPGQVEESEDDVLTKARQRIMDPNAKSRSIGDYFDTALEASLKKHGVSLEGGNW